MEMKSLMSAWQKLISEAEQDINTNIMKKLDLFDYNESFLEKKKSYESLIDDFRRGRQNPLAQAALKDYDWFMDSIDIDLLKKHFPEYREDYE